MKINFKAGDKVRFLHEKGEGIVRRTISAYRVVVELAGGLEIEENVQELVTVAAIALPDVTANNSAKINAGGAKYPSVRHSKAHATSEKVVDLHFENISESAGTLNNGQKLKMQIDYFEQELARAIRGHIKKIVFVHGVGSGVLRNSIRDILKGYEGLEYSDAPYHKYGAGATEVRIVARNKAR